MSENLQTQSILFQPGRIGSLELPHRILMGSMHLGIEGERGMRERLAEFYLERARGGAALIITGGAAVAPEGGGDHMFNLADSEARDDLAFLARRVGELGEARIALQLFHSGRYVRSREIGMEAIAPSAVPSRFTGETPREMSLDDIARVIGAFADGAAFAKEAGFHGVEVMASEGYLLNEFVSPITNQRSDAYGGDLDGRMRMNLEVVEAIRRRVGREFPVIFRMSGADCMPESTTWEETLTFARRLEEVGVDALDVGVGWHEARVPTVAAIVPHGGFARVAAGIRATVKIPVIGANRINNGETAARLVSSGWLDFVAPARPWLADAGFAAKIRSGEGRRINTCLACNQACLDHNFSDPPIPVSCLVNPRAGNELKWPRRRAETLRRVAVVGGGPAGLEAARAAAERGHAVTLFEAENDLGGQFRMASRVPGKGEFEETLRYYREMLESLKVGVELGVRARAADLIEFDRVVLATGVVPFVPELPGVDGPNVYTYPQIFRDEVALGKKVVIVGSGGIGCDLAHFLGERSRSDPASSVFADAHGIGAAGGEPSSTREITILSRSGKVARQVGRTTRWVLLSELRRLGVTVEREFRLEAIEPGGVVGQSAEGRREIEAEQVVLCTGQRSNRRLEEELRGRVAVEVVGGAKESRGINAAAAIREAFETAYAM